jgi:hypothetical protein
METTKEMVLLEKLKDEIEIVPTDPKQVQSFILKHYLGNWPTNVKKIYGIIHIKPEGKEMVGMAIYGSPMTSATKIVEPEASPNEVMELKRLFIEDYIDLPNVESFVISKTLKMIKEEFPRVKIVITFADDKAGHTGTIYQATNAIYLGISSSGKHKYAYILRGNIKSLLNLLKRKQQAYPKK